MNSRLEPAEQYISIDSMAPRKKTRGKKRARSEPSVKEEDIDPSEAEEEQQHKSKKFKDAQKATSGVNVPVDEGCDLAGEAPS